MSLFTCARCAGYADADDGCGETPSGRGLICVDCLDDEPDDESDGCEAIEPSQPHPTTPEGK